MVLWAQNPSASGPQIPRQADSALWGVAPLQDLHGCPWWTSGGVPASLPLYPSSESPSLENGTGFAFHLFMAGRPQGKTQSKQPAQSQPVLIPLPQKRDLPGSDWDPRRAAADTDRLRGTVGCSPLARLSSLPSSDSR